MFCVDYSMTAWTPSRKHMAAFCSGARKNASNVSWNDNTWLGLKERKDCVAVVTAGLQQQQQQRRHKACCCAAEWLEASCVCIKRKQCGALRCVALPPPLSARGRMSTFSLDPWQNPTTKLHRETGNAILLSPHYWCPTPETRCPPLSAIVWMDRPMPRPVSAARSGGTTRNTPVVFYRQSRDVRGKIALLSLFI